MKNMQTYRTRKAALDVIATMQGWIAKPERLYIPDDGNADKSGNTWVISCRDLGSRKDVQPRYMDTEGYVT